jgi:glutamate 5-kinase
MSRESVRAARRIVVKIGSRLLAEAPAERTAAVAAEIVALRARGVSAVVVSSGAIALGRQILKLAERPKTLPLLQGAAAVGQGRLMQHWETAFAAFGIPVGQVLLTHDDVGDRTRFLSARHALFALGEYGAVPIVNENDTVATEEIKFGDNDQLAALVGNLVGADTLVVLTDVVGLCDAPPDKGGKRIPIVRDVDEEAVPVAGNPGTLGTGGMASKVQAAKIAARSGIATLVVPGREPGILGRALGGDDVGTLFLPSPGKLASRKHWIAFGLRPAGELVVDDGARAALVEKGRSLLPSGIREVRGQFSAGESVRILDPQGREFARGLVGYGAGEIDRIRGRRSADIEGILGYTYLDEVIHRDDLVITL